MRRISQFNTFPFEDQARLLETKGVPAGCKHEFGEWFQWTSIEPERQQRWGRHCNKCPKWECLCLEDIKPSFSYTISKVERGVLLKLKYNVTGEVREFFQAGMSSTCPMEMHMRNMTNDLMLSWFVKFKKKEKKVKNEAQAVPKASKRKQPSANLPGLQHGSVLAPSQDSPEAVRS